MINVFIAGHGRMVTKTRTISVPTGMTLHWAVKPGYNSAGGLSKALISGAYADWKGIDGPGASVQEHYLCPDDPMIMSTKGDSLALRPDKASCYLLQPKHDFAVSLSAILAFLQQKLGPSLNVYWTCCRSPINESSRGKLNYLKGSEKEEIFNGGNLIKSPKADAQVGDVIRTTKANGVAVSQKTTDINKQTVRKTEHLDANLCMTSIEGAVTLVRGDNKKIGLAQTWPAKLVLAGSAGELEGDKTVKAKAAFSKFAEY